MVIRGERENWTSEKRGRRRDLRGLAELGQVLESMTLCRTLTLPPLLIWLKMVSATCSSERTNCTVACVSLIFTG